MNVEDKQIKRDTNVYEPAETIDANVKPDRFSQLPEPLQALYAPPPKPQYDETLPENIQRVAKANALAKGFSALGNALSLGIGGNVEKPKQDRETPAYFNAYQRMMEKRQDMDNQYNYNVWQNNVRQGMHKEQMDFRKGRAKQQDKQFDTRMDFQKNRAGVQDKQWQKSHEFRVKRAEVQDEQFQQSMKQNDAQFNARLQQNKDQFNAQMSLEQYKQELANLTKANKGAFVLYNDDGTQAVSLNNDGKIEKAFGLLMSDERTKELAQNDINLLKSTFGEGLTMQNMKNILAKYWKEAPTVVSFFNGGVKPETDKDAIGATGATVSMSKWDQFKR